MNEHPIKFFEKNELVPRDQQKQVIEEISTRWNDFDYFALSLPTGVGKTYIATAIASVVEKAYILTSTLQLQTQYEQSWKSLVNLKGRSNYTCNLNSNFTVDAAPCAAQPELIKMCIRDHVCSYYNQKERAISSQSMITNPSYMLYSTHCGFTKDEDSGWTKRSVVIIDEAHNLENHLISFAESDIIPEDLEKEYGIKASSFVFTIDDTENYLMIVKLYEELMLKAEEMAAKIEQEFPAKRFLDDADIRNWAKGMSAKVAERVQKLNAKYYQLDKKIQPLKIFFNTHSSPEELSRRWMIRKLDDKNGLKLSPIYGDFLFKEYFGKLADKFIFLSATLGTKEAFCKELGIETDKCHFIETDSPFDAQKSPVIVMPSIKLSKEAYRENVKKIGSIIDEIMNIHEGERGIIHSVTYDIQTNVFNQVTSKNQQRLLCRDMFILRGDRFARNVKNEELLKLHHSGKDIGTVLLSPSMMEGVDLYDDLSRFQIIIKLPWANLGDARVRLKSQLDNEWYQNKMWVSILQASGRSTRHEEDTSITYILDSNFKYFYQQWKAKLPGWFKRRLVF